MKTSNFIPSSREGFPKGDARKMRLFHATLQFSAVRSLLAVLCALLILPGDPVLYAQPAPQAQGAPQLSLDQLDSLVAPIALYPDPLLAQVLAASTYPLEMIQLQQWLQAHPGLKDKALADAVQKEQWDPSVQAMAALPDAVKRLTENIKWTTDLGNAFLAQQSDVMDAVQRMRAKAESAGALKSTEQQKVETKVVESKTVVVIEQANPEVVYVPSYNPVVVYGAPIYPYPVIYYPPPPPVGAALIGFGVGLAIGAAWGGGWGYGCGWGHNDVNININNNYIRHYNNTNVNNRMNISGNGTWQHNPQHRGGAPYPNQGLANRYGGTTRGASPAARQATARQNIANRQQPGAANRAGAGNWQQPSVANRGAGGGASADRIGNRSVTSGGSSRGEGAFGGGGGGFSGSSARASSARGSTSMASRGGGRRR